jgi:hypothetical protein
MPSLQCRPPLWGIAAAFLTLSWPVPASASVTCAVRQHGQFVCTYFCRDGFTCDVANNRCIPGPQLQQNLSAAQQAAQQATLNYNNYLASAAQQSNSQTLGYDMGSYYYIWDGDPREIPTPRYRASGGIPSGGASRSTPINAPVRQYTVRPQHRDQLLALLAAARSFAPNNPNRADAVKLLRRFVHDNKIPVDVDTLLDCGKPDTATPDQIKTVLLQWDEAGILSEIQERHLCDQVKNDDELKACKDYQFGQVVMSVEPEIKALCKAQENDPQEKDLDALGECAEAKFRNGLATDGKIRIPVNGTAVAGTDACPAIDAKDVESLRERLRRALAAAHANDGDDDTPDDTPSPQMQQPAQADQPPAPPPEANDDEDPYCAFIARRAVRGELTSGGGAQIPDYCHKALDKAKSCEEQKCSMADIIDREEHDRSRSPFHWGADDYQAIEAHLK